jgi:acetate kinase
MPKVLVINAGSSTLKMAAFQTSLGPSTNSPDKRLWNDHLDCTDHLAAFEILLKRLRSDHSNWSPDIIGHRIVHGGPNFSKPVRITSDIYAQLKELTPLAPLHQPANLAGIDASTQLFPQTPQIACFDTAFHQTRSFASQTYAIPRQFFEQGIRRYGFHGLSYQYICEELQLIAPTIASKKIIVCHLGNGASLAAIENGQCCETTMGFTPTDGLPMGTRCGQIDPGILLYWLKHDLLTADEINSLITKKSGLLGLSGGFSSDMRALLESNTQQCRDAIEVFVYRVCHYIGALTASLQGLDALIFTGGIGENANSVRADILSRLQWLGIRVDPFANQNNRLVISSVDSKVGAFVIPTDEERVIARAATILFATQSI